MDPSHKGRVDLFRSQVPVSLCRDNQSDAGNEFRSGLQKGRCRYQDRKGSGNLLKSDTMEGDSG